MTVLKSISKARDARKQGQGVLATEADMRRATQALIRRCPHLKRVVAVTGVPALRDYEPGFEGLARIVVGQQVSAQSAAAIWSRTRGTIEPFDTGRFLAATDAELRAAGLSSGKVRTLRRLSVAIATGDLDLDALEHRPDDEVIATLTRVSGIGPWTANLYLLFSLRRGDGWASGDLALSHAVRSALGLDERPAAAVLDEIAERWRPWRGAAAHILWAWYAHPASRAATASAAPDPLRHPQRKKASK